MRKIVLYVWIFSCFSWVLAGCKDTEKSLQAWQSKTIVSAKKHPFRYRRVPEFNFWTQSEAKSELGGQVIFPETSLEQIHILGFLQQNQKAWILAQNPEHQNAIIQAETLVSKDHLWVKKIENHRIYLVNIDGKDLTKTW